MKILLSFFMITFISVIHSSAQSEGDKLRALFGDECILACFMEMEPGVTTIQEVEASLEQASIEYERLDLEDVTIVSWQLEEQELVTDAINSLGIIVVEFYQGIVLKVSSPINVKLNILFEVFGYPDTIVNEDEVYYLVYVDLSILFMVLDFDIYPSDYALALVSTLPNYPNSYVSNAPGEIIFQTCTTYGVPPCIAPTATPTLIPLPTAAPTHTPTPVPFKAKAGPDQSIQIVHDGMTLGNPIAYVTLNGSQSTGSITGYQWSRNGQTFSNQSVVTRQLVPGTYIFTLTISNGAQTNTDNVTVYITTCMYGTAGCGSPTE